MTRGQQIGRAGFGIIRNHIENTAIFADCVIGCYDQRFIWQALGQRRQRRVADDPLVQRADARILAERQLAVRQLLERRQLVLLRVLSGRDALHVRNGDRRAVRPGRVSKRKQQQDESRQDRFNSYRISHLHLLCD